jgi:hypothetical protein
MQVHQKNGLPLRFSLVQNRPPVMAGNSFEIKKKFNKGPPISSELRKYGYFRASPADVMALTRSQNSLCYDFSRNPPHGYH